MNWLEFAILCFVGLIAFTFVLATVALCAWIIKTIVRELWSGVHDVCKKITA